MEHMTDGNQLEIITDGNHDRWTAEHMEIMTYGNHDTWIAGQMRVGNHDGWKS